MDSKHKMVVLLKTKTYFQDRINSCTSHIAYMNTLPSDCRKMYTDKQFKDNISSTQREQEIYMTRLEEVNNKILTMAAE